MDHHSSQGLATAAPRNVIEGDWHLVHGSTDCNPLADFSAGFVLTDDGRQYNTQDDGPDVNEDFVVVQLAKPLYAQICMSASDTASAARKPPPLTSLCPEMCLTQSEVPLRRFAQAINHAADTNKYRYTDLPLRKSGKHYVIARRTSPS